MAVATSREPGGAAAVMAVRETSGVEVKPNALTRNRFLKIAGSTVFGCFAYHVLKADPAMAHLSTPPACCGPSGQCSCCSGSTCCSAGCTRRLYECGGSAGGWYCCNNYVGAPLYFCADWWDSDGHRCICAGRTGTCY
jgi:hypothetical protein